MQTAKQVAHRLTYQRPDLTGARFQLRFLGGFVLAMAAEAAVPAWTFKPDRIGNALIEGGWSVERRLGVVNGSPEFTFPLQLVYLTTRTQRGFFGDQWFVPQLESFVLPRDKKELLWQMPSGKRILLTFNRKAKAFTDSSGEWSAAT